MSRAILDRLRVGYERIAAIPPADLALGMTLALILVRPGPDDPWFLVVPTTALAIVGLIDEGVRRSAGYWLAMAAIFLFVNNFIRYELADNHKFLTSYWCLAIALSLRLRDPDSAIAINERIFLGLVFGWATVQKILSDSYLDGTMFEMLLIHDERFFPLAYFFCGVTPDVLAQNQRVVEEAMRNFHPESLLQGAEGARAMAVFLTWWTVLIEGLIALIFLLPRRLGWTRGRDLVLLIFVVTTYPPTNVVQFGWLILTFGVAQTRPEMRRTRMGYLLAFIFIFLFSTGGFRHLLIGWAKG